MALKFGDLGPLVKSLEPYMAITVLLVFVSVSCRTQTGALTTWCSSLSRMKNAALKDRALNLIFCLSLDQLSSLEQDKAVTSSFLASQVCSRAVLLTP